MLVFVEGESRHALRGKRVRIGRDATCEVVVDHPSVASLHAVAHVHDGYVRIEAIGSSLVVAGADALRRARMVRVGDRVMIGEVELLLEADAKASSSSRDIAAELVRSTGETKTHASIEIVEGSGMGTHLELDEEGRDYDLSTLVDDARVHVVRRAGQVLMRASVRCELGSSPVDARREIVWNRTHVLRVGEHVLALRPGLLEVVSEISRRVIRSDPPPPVFPASAPSARVRHWPVLVLATAVVVILGSTVFWLAR